MHGRQESMDTSDDMHILPRVFEPRQRPRDGFDVNCESVAEKMVSLMVTPPVYSYWIVLPDESFR